MTEATIRARVEHLARSVRAKDIDAVMSSFAPGVVSFDIAMTLRYAGADRKRRTWEELFAAYEAIDYEVSELGITIDGDLAVAHGVNHFSGTSAAGDATDVWLRWTACFQRIDGVWLIVHDHVSVPADLEHRRALVDLTP